VVFLGIDGGGSKTSFLLEDEAGAELGRVETGPSNWLSTGQDEARRNIASGIAQLKTLPGIVGAGFAGAGRPEGIHFYRDCLANLLPNAKLFVETDAFISYAGAIGLKPGVLLIAGTGSIAIGRRRNGAMIRVGGWGPIFSDDGSGFWIGREVIRAALSANDAGVAPKFVASVCKALRIQSITDVSGAWAAGTLTVQSVASLTTLVLANPATDHAKRILGQAASHLRSLTQLAIARVGLPQCRLSIAGSIASHPLIRKRIRMKFSNPDHPPEKGAIIWARSQARH